MPLSPKNYYNEIKVTNINNHKDEDFRMRKEYVTLVEQLNENPSVMFVNNKPGDMEDSDAITFGFYNGDLYSGVSNKTYINGKEITIEDYEPSLIALYKDMPKDFLLNHVMAMPKDTKSMYHYKLAIHAMLYNVLKDYKAIRDSSNVKIAALNEIIYKHKHELNSEEEANDMVSRDGLTPAGRIFPRIKGISFYNPAKVPNSLVDKIFGLLGLPDKEDYVIESKVSQDASGGESYKQRNYSQKAQTDLPTNRQVTDKEVADNLLRNYAAKKEKEERLAKAKDENGWPRRKFDKPSWMRKRELYSKNNR